LIGGNTATKGVDLPDQVQIRELLKDPEYRKWFSTDPKMSPRAKWRVYAQPVIDGPWKRADFTSWKKAYRFFAKNFKSWHDAALVCRNFPSDPPSVRVKVRIKSTDRRGEPVFGVVMKSKWLPGVLTKQWHTWCPHCRRPTLFGYFAKHHAFTERGIYPLRYKLRCSICGVALDVIRKYDLSERR
jgi:hypothetical protein